jgi:hypothetical protein
MRFFLCFSAKQRTRQFIRMALPSRSSCVPKTLKEPPFVTVPVIPHVFIPLLFYCYCNDINMTRKCNFIKITKIVDWPFLLVTMEACHDPRNLSTIDGRNYSNCVCWRRSIRRSLRQQGLPAWTRQHGRGRYSCERQGG